MQISTAVGDSTACARCGMAVDASYFDDSRIVPLPPPGREVVLAQFELRPQYCGVLEYFSQYTNLLVSNRVDVETPGLEWALLSNGRPLAPYHQRFNLILNPWGFGSFQIALRIEEGATVQLVAKNRGYTVAPGALAIERIGGRIVGRYWYDGAYGDARRRGA
jgi:hypothetical protein